MTRVLILLLALGLLLAACSSTASRPDGESPGDLAHLEGPKTSKIVDSRPLERWITEDAPRAGDGGSAVEASHLDRSK